jgi:hypothetical protein
VQGLRRAKGERQEKHDEKEHWIDGRRKKKRCKERHKEKRRLKRIGERRSHAITTTIINNNNNNNNNNNSNSKDKYKNDHSNNNNNYDYFNNNSSGIPSTGTVMVAWMATSRFQAQRHTMTKCGQSTRRTKK